MVGVEVREEDLLEIDEADRRAQQLALRPLAAVEEQPLAAAADEQRARAAPRRRRAAGGAEEDEVEVHAADRSSPPRRAPAFEPGRHGQADVLRQDELLARADRRAGEVVRLLDPPDRVADVTAVVRRGDRPQRVVRLHAVDGLRPVRARRAAPRRSRRRARAASTSAE